LVTSGDLAEARPRSPDPQLLDSLLGEAVRSFQWRHGLEVDGVVGPRTTAALNFPIVQRIAQIEANLQRWRRLPRELGDRYFIVNIADFTVDLIEEGERIRRIPVIVGRPDRQTPEFSAEMTEVVLAPYWHVPPGIARIDQVPMIKADTTYLSRNRMVLLDATTDLPVDPDSIDWATITGAEFNDIFRLRQDPGEMNPLGQVKLLFPNEHDVYMHDTPSQHLFSVGKRMFSSGCVRVIGAMELAAHLLREDPTWTPERMKQIIERGVEESVPLPTPYQVHIGYWTAWVDEDGVLHFRDDVYGRDGVDHPGPEAPGPP
jgi:murein L,D-transpeptidase YcbB/YkuD